MSLAKSQSRDLDGNSGHGSLQSSDHGSLRGSQQRRQSQGGRGASGRDGSAGKQGGSAVAVARRAPLPIPSSYFDSRSSEAGGDASGGARRFESMDGASEDRQAALAVLAAGEGGFGLG